MADIVVKDLLVIEGILKDIRENYVEEVEEIGRIISDKIKAGGILYTCGNGGNACNAIHMPDDLIGKFKFHRPAIAAAALGTDYATITMIGNDYGYDKVFSRQLEGLGKEGDVLLIFSTSGKSPNLVEAIKAAKERGIYTIGLLGKGGGTCGELADYSLVIDSDDSSRIEEVHMVIAHILCELIEKALHG